MLFRAIKIIQGVIRERAKEVKRSPKWKTVRERYLEKNPSCKACGGGKLMQVHHIQPYHMHPELELDESNLIGLCQWNLCHIQIAHGGDFKFFVPSVVDDSARCLADKNIRDTIVEHAKTCRLPDEPTK